MRERWGLGEKESEGAGERGGEGERDDDEGRGIVTTNDISIYKSIRLAAYQQ